METKEINFTKKGLSRLLALQSIIGVSSLSFLLDELDKQEGSLEQFVYLLNISDYKYSRILKTILVWSETSNPSFFVGIYQLLSDLENNN
jgi:hypothetical protein